MQNSLIGLLKLARIPEWSKSFGNMAIAAITAGLFLGAGISPVRFLIGFASMALLWSGLYALNDYTDRKADAQHPVKKKRAIPAGLVPAKTAFAFAIILIVLSLGIAFYLNRAGLFTICILAMLANQIMYTTKPFSLKKRPIVDLISGSLINPVFRFYAGWVLFVPFFNAPWQVLIFIMGIQFGGFGLYRMASKEHEKKLGLKSSVVLFGEKNIRRLAYVSLGAGALAYIYATFTVLPITYFWLGMAMLLAAPLYKNALKNPQKIDLKKMYHIVYIQYLVFIAGFVLLYLAHIWGFL